MITPKLEELNNGSRRAPNYIKKNYSEFYDYILKNQKEKTFPEFIYTYFFGEPRPCPVCGSRPKFKSFDKGYAEYCSIKCSNSDPNKKEKIKQTNLVKYGGTGFESKDLRKKSINTTIKRYGENYKEKISNKRKVTNLEKYGVEYGLMSDIVREKIKNTCQEKYGVDNVFLVKDIYDKARNSFIEKYGVENPMESDEILKRLHKTNLKKYGVLFPFQSSEIQKKCHNHDTYIEQFIQNILNKYNINYNKEDHSIIPPSIVDFSIPDKKLTIECNGIYWHSDKCREPSHHKNRFKKLKELGWQQLTIWEDQIINKPDIVESVILSKLGIFENKIFARKCIIKEISSKECCNFLENNHIQGKTTSKIKLGAFHNSELIGVMTFIQSRGCQGSKNEMKDTWEMNRFCTLINSQVVGLVSKMISYFIKKYNPKQLISFSHNDISVGSVYKKLGFITNGIINNSYYYIKYNKRYHRSNFTRADIVRRWPEYDINDKTWTERSVMDGKGYFRIYDCGTIKWVKILYK